MQPIVRRLPKGPGKRVLCYGDSNTWGYIPGTGLRYRYRKRWPGIVRRELGNEFSVIEEGLSGRTTVLDDPEGAGRNGKKSLLHYLRLYQPLDLVILLLGTNDLKTYFNRTPDQIAEGIKELGNMILSSQTGSERKSPVLLLIAPPTVKGIGEYISLFQESEAKSVHLAKKFQLVAEELHCEFLDAGKVIESSALDGIHWDEDAHQEIGNVIAKMVRALLTRSGKRAFV